ATGQRLGQPALTVADPGRAVAVIGEQIADARSNRGLVLDDQDRSTLAHRCSITKPGTASTPPDRFTAVLRTRCRALTGLWRAREPSSEHAVSLADADVAVPVRALDPRLLRPQLLDERDRLPLDRRG